MFLQVVKFALLLQVMGVSDSQPEKSPTYAIVLPDCVLDKPCSEEYLRALAPFIIQWEQFAIQLGIGKDERILITYNSPDDLEDQKIETLLAWRYKMGSLATYRAMFNFFDKVHDTELTDSLIAVLRKSYPSEVSAHERLL